MKLNFLGAAVVASLVWTGRALATETMVDDFNAGIGVWTLAQDSGGGATQTGTLAAGPGRIGGGARVTYDFSTSTSGVLGLSRTFPKPLPAAALAFYVRATPGMHFGLRVADAGGETYDYPLRRLGDLDPSSWHRYVVALNAPVTHSGGTADAGAPQGGIASMTLYVTDPIEPPGSGSRVGSFGVDDVSLFDAVAVTIHVNDTPVPLPKGVVGNDTFSARMGIDLVSPTLQDIQEASTGGFGWARSDLPWAVVEQKQGVYAWTSYQLLAVQLASRGMRPHFVLGYGNPLYTGVGDAGFDDKIGPTGNAVPAFAAYAASAAVHFPELEIWNEWDSAADWHPAPNAADYSLLANATVASIRKAVPSATVVTGGMRSFEQDRPLLDVVLGSQAAATANAIGVHPFRTAPPEEASDAMMLLRAEIDAQDPGKAVWDTAWGYAGGSFDPLDPWSAAAMTKQGVWTVRKMLASPLLGLSRSALFELRDDGDPDPVRGSFGLVKSDYTEKTAMKMVQTLHAATAGSALVGTLSDPSWPSSLHVASFWGSTPCLALWLDAEGETLDVTLDSIVGFSAVDALGNPLSPNGATFTLREAAGPIYLLGAPPPPADGGIGLDGEDAGPVGDYEGGGFFDGGYCGGGCCQGSCETSVFADLPSNGAPYLAVVFFFRRRRLTLGKR